MLAPFGWEYLRYHKRQEKSIDILRKDLGAINSKGLHRAKHDTIAAGHCRLAKGDECMLKASVDTLFCLTQYISKHSNILKTVN